MILSTVPGIVTLGCSGMRVVSRSRSAVRANRKHGMDAITEDSVGGGLSRGGLTFFSFGNLSSSFFSN